MNSLATSYSSSYRFSGSSEGYVWGAKKRIANLRVRGGDSVSLFESGWTLQNRDEMNLSAARGVAVPEFKLAPGHGYVDYILFVDGKAVGVLEAKPEAGRASRRCTARGSWLRQMALFLSGSV